MIQPTLRAFTIFAIGVPLALLLAIYDPALWLWSFAYGALVLAVIAADFARAFPPRRLQATVDTPHSLQVGDHGLLTVTIAPAARQRRLSFELVREQSPDADPGEIVRVVREPGQAAQVRFPLWAQRRGKMHIIGIWVRWRGPFGLVQLSRRIAVDRLIDVVPNVRGVRSSALQFFSREVLFGNKVQEQRGEGTEFDALREYTAGLDSRFIDWKHSARHRKLLSKEFRTERNHQIILAFDTGYLMVDPVDGLPRLDHAINAGLLLAWISLQGGDFVGLLAFDEVLRQYHQPRRGVANFPRLQRATAGLDYRHSETNFTLGLAELGARLQRRALVILFTDFVDTVTAELMIEATQRIARRHVVVFVTLRDAILHGLADAPPVSFGAVAQSVIAHGFLRERLTVFERLQRIGIHCLDVPSRSLPVGLINRYLMIKQRGLL
ncbi:MAG TPA: DUF58 domain-containing protein [Xanthobacteraceae bacterium]|nr:DUF58 domain-containing protein [Xanthobacteraceae bacterium]